jgi:hypothetical protein
MYLHGIIPPCSSVVVLGVNILSSVCVLFALKVARYSFQKNQVYILQFDILNSYF